MIPESLHDIYPNPIQEIHGKPAVIFRDHRWTLPVLYLAGRAGRIELPAPVVTFDRHPDSLEPGEDVRRWLYGFREDGSLGRLIDLVANRLSARDDDWVPAGMELGLISDVVRFGTEHDGTQGIFRYRDAGGVPHRVFHLDRPKRELSYKGALADPLHEAAREGVRDVIGWDPETGTITARRGGLLLDIDLDFFTMAWEMYTFPFPEEVYAGEFFEPCQSDWRGDYRAVDFFRGLVGACGVVTVACEPDFCDGRAKAETILSDVNRILLGGAFQLDGIAVDYAPVYPNR